MCLVGKKVPDFVSGAVLNSGEIIDQYHLYKEISDKYALIFFYPLNFTFVCPSELISLNNKINDFNMRGIEVIAVSIDSQYAHSAWRNTSIEEGGIGKLNYTLVSDLNHSICKSYGVEHETLGVSFRASFLVDRDNIVRFQYVNDLPIGRNVNEIIRLFDALSYYENNGYVCQAGWKNGETGILPTKEGVSHYLKDNYKEL